MKQHTEKIGFTWKGLKFKNITVGRYTHSNGDIGIYTTMRGVSQVVTQYIKQKYPEVKFQIKTDSFSMGDSVDVYINPLHTKREVFETINKDLVLFNSGGFDSMTDYAYTIEGRGISGMVKGQKLTFDTKYMSCYFKPKYGTKAYDEWNAVNK